MASYPPYNDPLESDTPTIARVDGGRAKLVGVEFAGGAFQNHG